MSRIVCVSNRVSLPDPETGEIKAGGLAVGIAAALENQGKCVWFGWNGTVTARANSARVLPHRTQANGVTFLTIPLTEREYNGYYKKVANGTLWPLMHGLGEHVEDNDKFFPVYEEVNQLFARRLAPYLKPDDIVWVHDYHLIPLARTLRNAGITNTIIFFNHIPVPANSFIHSSAVSSTMRRQYRKLINDLFYYDQVGFQSYRDFHNFSQYLNYHPRMPERFSTIPLGNGHRQTRFGVFPISIETLKLERKAKAARYNSLVTGIRHGLGGCKLVIGAERLDYTKGLHHRIEGLSCFFSNFPEYRENLKYLQIAPLSRDDVKEYQAAIAETRAAVNDIQLRFGNGKWKPVYYSERNVPRDSLLGCFRISDIGLVTPLIDGQNLVAKEYLAAQDSADPGVLILSKYAGAAEELGELGVILVDPFDPKHIAAKLRRALQMPLEERQELHRAALSYLRRHDIYHWCEKFLACATAAEATYPIAIPVAKSGADRKAWNYR